MVLYVLQHDVNSKNNFYKKTETKLNLTWSCKIESSYFLNIHENLKLSESLYIFYDCHELHFSYIGLYVLQHDVNSKNNFYKKTETKLNLTWSCKIESSYFWNIYNFPKVCIIFMIAMNYTFPT